MVSHFDRIVVGLARSGEHLNREHFCQRCAIPAPGVVGSISTERDQASAVADLISDQLGARGTDGIDIEIAENEAIVDSLGQSPR